MSQLSGPNKQYVAPYSSHDQGLRMTRLEVENADLARMNDILRTALRNLISVCKALDIYNRYKKLIDAAIAALDGRR